MMEEKTSAGPKEAEKKEKAKQQRTRSRLFWGEPTRKLLNMSSSEGFGTR